MNFLRIGFYVFTVLFVGLMCYFVSEKLNTMEDMRKADALAKRNGTQNDTLMQSPENSILRRAGDMKDSLEKSYQIQNEQQIQLLNSLSQNKDAIAVMASADSFRSYIHSLRDQAVSRKQVPYNYGIEELNTRISKCSKEMLSHVGDVKTRKNIAGKCLFARMDKTYLEDLLDKASLAAFVGMMTKIENDCMELQQQVLLSLKN